VKKTRQNNNLEAGFDSIDAGKVLVSSEEFPMTCSMNAIARKSLTALALTLAMTSVGLSQGADPKGCSAQERSNQNLSQDLGRTNGVICPAEVDPGIAARAPDVGKMPVIPPPGSPGGDPIVQPK
jgi:hypothetical protein